MSIPFSSFIYSKYLGINEIRSSQIGVILIVLLTGLQDILIFHSAWIRANKINCIQHDIRRIISHCLREAGYMIFLTTLCTTIVFLACLVSKIMPIQSFGLFAIILVPVLDLITILIQPLFYFLSQFIINEKIK